MEAAMEPVANDLWGLLLSWLPAALLLAATALLPTLLLRTTRSLRKRLYEYLPEWMRILLEGYEKPLAEMLRLLCLVGMLMALPLGFNTTVYRSMILKLLGVAAGVPHRCAVCCCAAPKTAWIWKQTGRWPAFLKIFSVLSSCCWEAAWRWTWWVCRSPAC